MTALGYLREDGRKGIRNHVLVAYLVECAHHVARAIATPFEGDGVQLIGFSGCYPQRLRPGRDGCPVHPPECRRRPARLPGLREFNRSRLMTAISAPAGRSRSR